MKKTIGLLFTYMLIVLALSSCGINDLANIHNGGAAYALNDKELEDGTIVDFNQQQSTPKVSTILPSSISDTSAICGGIIRDDGNADIISRGICWSTNRNPTLDNKLGFTKNGIGNGSFESSISNLENSTKYYVAAYAINSVGVSYGGVLSFKTP